MRKRQSKFGARAPKVRVNMQRENRPDEARELRAEVYFDRGFSRIEGGDRRRGFRDLSTAIALAPSARNYGRRGILWLKSDAAKKAVADFNRALQFTPMDTDILVILLMQRAAANRRLGLGARSIADYDRVIRLAPRECDAWKERGSMHLAAGQFARAVADYTQLLRLRPSLANYLARAKAHRKWRKQKRAEADIAAALRIPPNGASDHETRGDLLLESGQLKSAIVEFGRAVQLAPDKPSPYYIRAKAFEELNDDESAAKDFRRVIEVAGRDSNGQWFRAAAYGKLRKYARCVREWSRLAVLDPSARADCYFEQAVIYDRLDKCGKARALYRKALDRYRAEGDTALVAESHFGLGMVQSLPGRYHRAVQEFTQAIDHGMRTANVFWQRGRCHDHLGRRAAALRDFSRAVRLDPSNANYWNSLGVSLGNLGRSKAALRAYNLAIELNKNCDLTLTNRGFLFLEMKRPQDAIHDLLEAVRLNRKSARAHTLLTDAYAAVGAAQSSARGIL